MRISDLKIRPKLVILFILTGLLPLILACYYGSHLSVDALMEKSFSQLVSIQTIRSGQLETAFRQRTLELKMLAASNQTREFVQKLMAFSKTRSPRSHPGDYQELVQAYGPALERFIFSYGCQDLKLFDGESGRLLYSQEPRHPLWEPLDKTAYAGTGLEQAWQAVHQTHKGILVDFEPFGPANNQETAFFAEPILDRRGILAVIVVQVNSHFINDIMESRKGMGETGESYILNWDADRTRFELRSDLKTMGEGQYIIGHHISQTLDYWQAAVERGFNGGSGTYSDSYGKPVLAAFNRLDIPGQDWYLVSKIDQYEVEKPVRSILIKTVLLSSGLVLIIAIVGFYLARGITRPLIEDMKFAQAIARGEYDRTLDLDQGDELGELARALNHMALTLHDQDWLKQGKETLDDAIRGELDHRELGRRFIGHIVQYLDAQVGALFLKQDQELHLTASYAFSDREGNFNRIQMGEGMVGQAALEQQVLVFTDVGDQGPDIHHGTGRRKAQTYMMVPLVFEDKLLGVFLIGSVRPITPLQRTFIEQNAPNAAILLNGATSRRTIQKLLKQAQKQHEELAAQNQTLEEQTLALRESESELQAQQEELRVTNEELEEQTQALKQSEEELQAQQEELKATNDALEKHTQALEQQKTDIHQKNQKLMEAQESIEKKARELEVASRYKSEFLANMSHELRTPLNAILILSQILSSNKDGNLTQKQVTSAQAVHSSGQDLLTLINEILDLSKVEAGKIDLHVEEVNLEAMAQDLRRTFQKLVEEKGLSFEISIAPDLPETLHTDPLRLQQVLRNLITNAVKFTSQGRVSLDMGRPQKKTAALGRMDPDHCIALAVKDEGIGIAREHQQHIFEAFHQADGSTSRRFGGTGLGLSISRELSRLLGGCILLESAPGKGSTFTVILPQKLEVPEAVSPGRDTPVSIPTPPAPPLPPKIRPENIQDDREGLGAQDKGLLIIEDDPNSARIIRDFARDRGFKCLIAQDGETGLAFAEHYQPCAIILDIGLPGIDGWTVLERLKGTPELRHIPVHFMSADDATLDAMRMGAVGFLTKPMTVEKVNDTFKRIEQIITRPVRKLLVVEDDRIQQKSICDLIGNGDVETTLVATGSQAFTQLTSQHFDCMILDLGLSDMSGFDLLERIRQNPVCATIPVIVYTGRDLTHEEDKRLRKYTESIIIKGVRSPERLLEESALFLHRVENRLPKEKQQRLKMVHDKETLLKDKRILLVDDDMRNVFALSSALEEKGMQVFIARDGIEGVEKTKANPEIDLILMDIMMPRMDGYEAMAEIRKENTDLPIIALTAKAMKGDRSKCIQAGASDYLAKPVDTDKLLSMLRVWLCT